MSKKTRCERSLEKLVARVGDCLQISDLGDANKLLGNKSEIEKAALCLLERKTELGLSKYLAQVGQTRGARLSALREAVIKVTQARREELLREQKEDRRTRHPQVAVAMQG